MRKSLKNKKPLAPFKRRRYYARVSKPLVWGNSGLKLLSRLILPRRRLRWIRVWMKVHYKMKFRNFRLKLKKRGRYYWFRVKHCMPCTKKSDKSRMGKGKGKLVGWYGNLSAGHFVLELSVTKSSIVRPLFRYLGSKFSARVMGVVSPAATGMHAFSGRQGSIYHFARRKLLSYKRLRFYPRKYALTQHKTDVQIL